MSPSARVRARARSITAQALRLAEMETAWRDRTVIPYARLHGW
jgi:hypothetical protein